MAATPHAAFSPRLVTAGIWLTALGIFGGALLLRTIQLADQVVVFDEWHSLRSALALGYGEIFSTFGEHSSIPLSLYYRLLLDTIGLDAASLRAPSLVAGLGLVAMPYFVLGRRSSWERAAIAAVYALSPLLIYHSRFARIYACATLLAIATLVAAWHWWERRRAGAGAAYAVLAALTGFATLAYLPFVLAPLVWCAASLVLHRDRRSPDDARRWLGVAMPTAILLGLLLGPAWLEDASTIEAKLGGATTVHWDRILRFATGASSTAIAVVWIAWAVVGIIDAWARHRRAASFALVPSVALLAGVAILAPLRVGEGPVFARYMLPCLVLGLASAALGILATGRRLRDVLPLAGAAASPVVLFVAWLGISAWGSPIRALFAAPSSWANEMLALGLDHPTVDPAKLTRRVPEIYRALASRPPRTTTIVEAPYTTFGLMSPFPAYQRRHRQRVLVASEAGACAMDNTAPMPADPAMHLPGVLYLADPESLRRSGAELLIVHRSPMRELSYFREDNWYAKNFRMSGDDCVGYAERVFGPPIAVDEDTAAFRLQSPLERLR